MARKTNRTTDALIGTHPTSMASDHGPPQGRRRRQPTMHNSSDGPTPRIANETTQTNRSPETSSSDTSIDEAAGGVDEDSASEADEDDGEDRDGDAIAPSDHTSTERGDQAGLLLPENEQQKIHSAGADYTSEIRERNLIPGQSSISRLESMTSSKLCESDDEAYNGVDEISDSDEDEPDVEMLEERNIIESEEAGCASKAATTTPTQTSESSDIWDGFDVDEGLYMNDIPYFDEQYGRTDQGILDNEIELFQLTSVFDDIEPSPLPQSPPSSARRVHFREPVPPPSEGSDIPCVDEDLNGLFIMSGGMYEEAAALPPFVEKDKEIRWEVNSGGDPSGYEPEDGDTTDEDEVPRSATTCPQSLLRQPSLNFLEEDIDLPQATSLGRLQASTFPLNPPATPTPICSGPRLGLFKTSRKRPYYQVDCTGDNLIETRLEKLAKVDRSFSHVTRTTPSRVRPSRAKPSSTMPRAYPGNIRNGKQVGFRDSSSQPISDPIQAPGSKPTADILLPSGLPCPSQPTSGGSESVFFPMDGMEDINALYAAGQVDEDNDDEEMLNVEDFIDFGVDSSENEADGLDTALPTPISTSPTGVTRHHQSKVPPPQSPSPNELMAHFDQDVIDAFRQGPNQQHQHPHRSHNGSSFKSHAMYSGRRASANSPVVPPKKGKMSGGSSGPPSKKRLISRR